MSWMGEDAPYDPAKEAADPNASPPTQIRYTTLPIPDLPGYIMRRKFDCDEMNKNAPIQATMTGKYNKPAKKDRNRIWNGSDYDSEEGPWIE